MASIVSLFSSCIALEILTDSIREQDTMGVSLSPMKGLHHLPNIGGSPGHPVEYPVDNRISQDGRMNELVDFLEELRKFSEGNC